MMTPEQSRRGQPILFLGLLLAGWTLIRVATWETPWPDPQFLPLENGLVKVAHSASPEDTEAKAPEPVVAQPEPVSRGDPQPFAVSPYLPAPVPAPLAPSSYDANFASGQHAVGHNLLWLAGMAALPMPREVDAALAQPHLGAQPSVPAAPRQSRGEKRWRVDAWLLLRDGASPTLAAGSRPATYGASQVGAVLAYRLAPSTRREPAAYVRASHALVADGESEVALGARIRPLGQLPVLGHVELRATRRGEGTELRPAAFLSGGLERQPLPAGLSLSGFVQAGAVGGEFASAFVDGSARIDRTLLKASSAQLDAGLGAWGGAQRDAARLDLGPTARISLELGGAPARIAADWRLRVAGNAEPSTGAAITLSTGF